MSQVKLQQAREGENMIRGIKHPMATFLDVQDNEQKMAYIPACPGALKQLLW